MADVAEWSARSKTDTFPSKEVLKQYYPMLSQPNDKRYYKLYLTNVKVLGEDNKIYKCVEVPLKITSNPQLLIKLNK